MVPPRAPRRDGALVRIAQLDVIAMFSLCYVTGIHGR